ncbi:hypothetical protein [Rubrivirga sp.]|uniref:hypothetical protein n=1 Tax=Rubrivirga sp. TaxID=1885344 RepID=UPI003B516752
MEPATDGGLGAFFEAYARAFEAYDADAIAACYVTPCLFVRDAETVVQDSAEGVVASVRSLLDLHRAWDVQRIRPAEVVTVEAGPAHAVARVGWRLGRARSRVAWSFATTYTLVPNDGWRIAVAITHDAPF